MWLQDNPRRRAERSDQIRTGINSWYSFDFTCDQSKQLPGARPHRATGAGLRPKQNIYARIVVREAGERTSELVKLWERGWERFGLPGGTDRENRAWFKWTTGWYKQRELSLVQVNYWGIQTKRTESGSSELPGDKTGRTETDSSELPGDTKRQNWAWFKWTTGGYKQKEPSLVQVNYRLIKTERTKPDSSELLGDTNRSNRDWFKWTTGW